MSIPRFIQRIVLLSMFSGQVGSAQTNYDIGSGNFGLWLGLANPGAPNNVFRISQLNRFSETGTFLAGNEQVVFEGEGVGVKDPRYAFYGGEVYPFAPNTVFRDRNVFEVSGGKLVGHRGQLAKLAHERYGLNDGEIFLGRVGSRVYFWLQAESKQKIEPWIYFFPIDRPTDRRRILIPDEALKALRCHCMTEPLGVTRGVANNALAIHAVLLPKGFSPSPRVIYWVQLPTIVEAGEKGKARKIPSIRLW